MALESLKEHDAKLYRRLHLLLQHLYAWREQARMSAADKLVRSWKSVVEQYQVFF